VGLFDRLKEAVSKTKQLFTENINTVITVFRQIDDDLFEELEEALILGDVGAETSARLVSRLRQEVRKRGITNGAELRPLLEELVREALGAPAPLSRNPDGPTVVLVVGVNGTGKTTSIGKLAHYLKVEQGRKVLLAAGDTFRAAAIDQLEIWGQRTGCELIRQSEGSDPAAVAFDAVKAAVARRADVVLIDTAGRLHNKAHLMEELRKVRRVIERELPGAPHETLLVLDATTGQNAVQQTRLFKEVAAVTGIVLTKLDGTAKGGVVIGIRQAEGVPIKFIGVGEKLGDLQPFDPEAFAGALFGE
jgi:fused signal recognition particle receptor